MTLGEALGRAREALASAGIETADAEARWMLSWITGRGCAQLVLDRAQPLGEAERAALETALQRRVRGEPLQHILGRTVFYGLELAADRRALVPRPETERLVELVLALVRDVARPAILDVGTGSGAIALALAHERPDARIMATDAHDEPLKLARENAGRLGLGVRFARSDLLTATEVQAFAREAHVIATNPPYLPEADLAAAAPEVRHDPPEALYAGTHGLDVFAALLAQARAVQPNGAWLVAELDPRNVEMARAAAAGWSDARIEPDLTGRPRFLVLRR